MQPRQHDLFAASPMAVTFGYLALVAFGLACYGVAWLAASEWMAMAPSELWDLDAPLGEALRRVWFVFVWAALLAATLDRLGARVGTLEMRSPLLILRAGAWLSAHAGIFEELYYRWLLFFVAMVLMRALDVVTFGLAEWTYTVVLLPVANVVTLGALAPQLADPAQWVVGAAVITTNATFRRAHQHAGLVAILNAWLMGMVYFWLLFNYDLRASIAAHVIYDLVVFSTVAVLAARRRRRLRAWLQSL